MADSSPVRRSRSARAVRGDDAVLVAPSEDADPAGADPAGADPAKGFGGHIDFHGYHEAARCWAVGGWMSQRPDKLALVLSDQTMLPVHQITFFPRDDLGPQGIGFVALFRWERVTGISFLVLLAEAGGSPHTIHAINGVEPANDAELASLVQAALRHDLTDPQSRQIQSLLQVRSGTEATSGVIDVYGYQPKAGGWLCAGWTSRPWRSASPPTRFTLRFDDGAVSAEGFAADYPRADLGKHGTGCVIFVRSPDESAANLRSISFESDGVEVALSEAGPTRRLAMPQLLSRLQPTLASTRPGPHRETLLTLARRGSTETEADTQPRATKPLLAIDEAVLCGVSGVVLSGWCIAPRSIVTAIRVLHGARVTELELARCIRIDRPDVIEALDQRGDADVKCGFIAWLADAIDPAAGARQETIAVELETSDGAVARLTVKPVALDSLAAIKHLLSSIDLRFIEASFAFDNVVGPAVATLNQVRLGVRPATEVAIHGVLPTKPRFSVIVPVYGRLDFVEYQFAFFSAQPHYASTEFIYVFDDPRQRRDAQSICRSVYERFRVPFKAVLLDRNVGYSPANNIGLAEARGEFVVFLNSDVFPETPDWLQRLAKSLSLTRDIGVIGPMLLFEDGSIQHRGMTFSREKELGNFHFAKHLDKGLRPQPAGGLQTHQGITGACMMMSRKLATKVGGFDEGYVVGDFEDSDLCFKIRALGYRCVVDPTVKLFHLERQSQAASAERWRMNLTVYNAWRHETRWGDVIKADRTPA